MKTCIIYQCEICGRKSENKEEIEKCESLGSPEMLVDIGQIINVADNEQTPINFNLVQFNFYLYDNTSEQWLYLKDLLYQMRQIRKYVVTNTYMVSAVNCHFRYYILEIYNWNETILPEIQRLTVDNETMKKILDAYNDGGK